MICPICGEYVVDGAEYCPECGYDIHCIDENDDF